MASDDKKTSPAPKSGAEKKEVTAKKDEGQPKDKTALDAIDLRLRAVRKLPAHPQVIVGARAKSRFRKHIGITGTRFTRERKRRRGNWINGADIAVSPRT
jgi:hypothetical protein